MCRKKYAVFGFFIEKWAVCAGISASAEKINQVFGSGPVNKYPISSGMI